MDKQTILERRLSLRRQEAAQQAGSPAHDYEQFRALNLDLQDECRTHGGHRWMNCPEYEDRDPDLTTGERPMQCFWCGAPRMAGWTRQPLIPRRSDERSPEKASAVELRVTPPTR